MVKSFLKPAIGATSMSNFTLGIKKALRRKNKEASLRYREGVMVSAKINARKPPKEKDKEERA